MEDDGGLSDALARVDAEFTNADFLRSVEEENARRGQSMVEDALAKQRAQVEKSAQAFLAEAKKLGVDPETILVGTREPEPAPSPPRKRFGRWRQGSKPAEPEPVYDRAFYLHRAWQEFERSPIWVRVHESGKVECECAVNKDSSYRGTLPFHIDMFGKVAGGSVPEAVFQYQLDCVERTTPAFIDWLARHLRDPPPLRSIYNTEEQRQRRPIPAEPRKWFEHP